MRPIIWKKEACHIEKEQKNTQYDLSKRIKTTPVDTLENEIIVSIDRATFNNQDFQIIQQLSEILQDSGEMGEFELGNLGIKINSLKEYQNELIKL